VGYDIRQGSVSDRSSTILLVDDEEALRRILSARLSARGYLVSEASSGEDACRVVPTLRPDVIVLDIGLPDIDGVEVTRRLRLFVQTPIIILSVHSTPSDKIAALDAGADDYLTKPCDLDTLLGRIRTILRRAMAEDVGVFASGDLKVDLRREVVQLGGKQIQLTEGEYELLRILVLNAGGLLTQRRLVREVWEEIGDEEGMQMLRTTISTLRQKLDDASKRSCHITLEPGVGYRLRIAPST
jgi:two-component system KDP operon response regulator KdpE